MNTAEFIAFCCAPANTADDIVWNGRHLRHMEFFVICAEHVLEPAKFKRVMNARGLDPAFWFEYMFYSSIPVDTCIALTERCTRRPVWSVEALLRKGTTDMVPKLKHLFGQYSMPMSHLIAAMGTRHAQREVRDTFVPLRGAVAVCLLGVPPRVQWRVWSTWVA